MCVHVCNITHFKTKRLRTPTKRLYVQYVLTCKCKLIVFSSLTDSHIHSPQTKLPAGSIHPSQRLWCETKGLFSVFRKSLECALMWVKLCVILPYILKGRGGKTRENLYLCGTQLTETSSLRHLIMRSHMSDAMLCCTLCFRDVATVQTCRSQWSLMVLHVVA